MGLIEKEGKIKGKWRLLGGKLEEGENSVDAMVRESFEEAGIKIEVVSFLGKIKGDIGERYDKDMLNSISGRAKRTDYSIFYSL